MVARRARTGIVHDPTAEDVDAVVHIGPVEPEENEPVFHADWEKRVYAINRALRTRGLVNIDEFRHGVERMNPAHYLTSSYYEHWLDSVARRE